MHGGVGDVGVFGAGADVDFAFGFVFPDGVGFGWLGLFGFAPHLAGADPGSEGVGARYGLVADVALAWFVGFLAWRGFVVCFVWVTGKLVTTAVLDGAVSI